MIPANGTQKQVKLEAGEVVLRTKDGSYVMLPHAIVVTVLQPGERES